MKLAELLEHVKCSSLKEGEAMHNGTVLIVDDEALIRDVLISCMEDHGIPAVVAEDAEAAMALIAQGMEFDCLVTDIRMPGTLSGWELARRARLRFPGIGVTYITGHGALEWAHEGVPHSTLLSKPFLPDVLAAQLKGQLSEHAAWSSRT